MRNGGSPSTLVVLEYGSESKPTAFLGCAGLRHRICSCCQAGHMQKRVGHGLQPACSADTKSPDGVIQHQRPAAHNDTRIN